jgi:nucleoside-diphosphate-sugar epimerase
MGHELDVVVDDQRLRPKKSEVSRLLGDSSKAQQLAGWRAEVSLDEGLRRTSEWIRSHLHEYRTQEYAI